MSPSETKYEERTKKLGVKIHGSVMSFAVGLMISGLKAVGTKSSEKNAEESYNESFEKTTEIAVVFAKYIASIYRDEPDPERARSAILEELENLPSLIESLNKKKKEEKEEDEF